MRLRLGAVEHELTTRSLVMGVVAGAVRQPGSAAPPDAALAQAEALVVAGADLLDLGAADAGRDGPMSEEEELECLVDAVESVRARFDIPVAVDTPRARVLAAAAAAGATVVTDRRGQAGPDHLRAACDTGVTIVASHTRPTGRFSAPGPGQADVVAEVRAFLQGAVATGRAAGIPDERMIVDAGLDQGKSPAQSLALLRSSAALADLGPPLLLDASNKRFLGLLLDLDVDERRMASHVAAALGIARGCRLVRAHDVRGARRVTDVLAALLGARLARVASDAESEGDGG